VSGPERVGPWISGILGEQEKDLKEQVLRRRRFAVWCPPGVRWHRPRLSTTLQLSTTLRLSTAPRLSTGQQ
jgi:hypothetical protein